MIGQVLDASAVDAVAGPDPDAKTWLAAAWASSTPLYVPALALGEVEAVRPHLRDALWELIAHPSVMRYGLDLDTAAAVASLLDEKTVFDATAGHVIVVARERGWPVLTADAPRLHRIDPTLPTIGI